MITSTNENLYGAAGGFGGYGWGGGSCGILGLIALLSLFRGHLGHGDFNGAHGDLNEIQNQLSNLRADIGDAKYDACNTTLNQTMALMKEVCAGNLQNLNSLFNQTMHLDCEFKGIEKGLCGIDKDVLENRWILDKDIVTMGLKNEICNLKQTNELSEKLSMMQHFNDKCCCETNRNIEKTGFETQLRDLTYKCDTDKQLKELECGQKAIMAKIDESRLIEENNRLRDKLECLREKDERNFIARATGKTNCLVNDLGQAAVAYTNLATPTTPFVWDFPSCGCGCY